MWSVRVEMIRCRPVEMWWWQGREVRAGARGADRGRKTWRECMEDDLKELGLHFEWVVFRDMWRSLISEKTSDPS